MPSADSINGPQPLLPPADSGPSSQDGCGPPSGSNDESDQDLFDVSVIIST